MNKRLAVFLLCAPAFAAVNGTLLNGTSGQPQAGVTVALDKLSQTGMESLGEIKTDVLGKFSFAQEIQGPHLLRATYQGVTYNLVLTPGGPTDGLTFPVFDASAAPGQAKISQHMILFEPADGKMGISETFLYSNPGKVTWTDAAGGTLKFYLPAGAKGEVQVNATAPGGMPVLQTAEKVGRGDLYKVNFPIKPGDTRIDVTYLTPYTAGAGYEAKIATRDAATRLVTPSTVTLTGENLTDLGQEPSTQAHIYDLKGTSYKIAITGQGAMRGAQNAAAADTGATEDSAGPGIEQILPRVNDKAKLILGIALAILALGFILLYRAPADPSKETNERRRG